MTVIAKRPLVTVATIAICLCVAGSANAFTGEYCSPTPSPSFTPKAIASYIKSAAASWGNKFENRACDYYALGILEAFAGDDKSAIDAYTRALAIMSNFADAYEARGDAYAELKMQDEADTDYSHASKASKDLPGALNTRCWVRAVRGVPLDRALADCNEALKQGPRLWAAYDTRCLVHVRMGNSAAAIADCNTALDRNKRLASSMYLRGLAKIQSGDRAGGNADVAAAKDMDYRIAEKYAIYGVKLVQKK